MSARTTRPIDHRAMDQNAPRSRKEALGPLKDGIRCAWCDLSEAEADAAKDPLGGISMGDLCYPACARCLADVANRRASAPRWAFDYETERWRRRTSRRLPAWDADEAVRVVWQILSGKRPIPPSVARRGGAATVEAGDGRGQVWAVGGDTILPAPMLIY